MKFEAGSTGSQTTKSNSSAKRSLKVAFEPDSVLRPSPIPAFRRIDSLCLPNLLVRDVVRVFNQESALVRNNSILFFIFVEIIHSDFLSEGVEILDRIEWYFTLNV